MGGPGWDLAAVYGGCGCPSITIMLGRAGLLMSGAVTQRAVARSISPVKECRRFASGGHGPSYNEPSGTYSCPLTRLGYLFGEKVHDL